MNSKQSKLLLRLIGEEISLYLSEQATPPTDPAAGATPPSDPSSASATPPTDSSGSGDEKDDVKKKVDTLSKQSDDDIRKTILAKLQKGSDKKDIEDILRYMEENKNETDPSKSVPKNLKKIVDQLKKDFGIKTPPPEPKKPEQPQAPSTATPPTNPAPVTESRLQKLAKEYLHYKKLYLRSQ
jgi:hypothetical protein